MSSQQSLTSAWSRLRGQNTLMATLQTPQGWLPRPLASGHSASGSADEHSAAIQAAEHCGGADLEAYYSVSDETLNTSSISTMSSHQSHTSAWSRQRGQNTLTATLQPRSWLPRPLLHQVIVSHSAWQRRRGHSARHPGCSAWRRSACET